MICTTVDFGTMHLAVEVGHLSPEVATLCGALLGAVTNFQLGRRWIFDEHRGTVAGQALRYTFVSAASAGLNALGEWGLTRRLGLEYHLARAIVAVAVSLLWNFPMQRHFVFRHGEKAG